MAAKKFAISVPEEVMALVDVAAAERGLTRSRFVAEVLERVASAQSDTEVRRRVNALFADPEIAREQLETARAFRSGEAAQGNEW